MHLAKKQSMKWWEPLFWAHQPEPPPDYSELAPPSPEKTTYGPKHLRDTDEWGVAIHSRGGPGRQNNDEKPDMADNGDTKVRLTSQEVAQAEAMRMSLVDFASLKLSRMSQPTPLPKPLTTAEEIKLLARTLTYGEMMELVAEIWRHSPEKSLTVDTAPAVLWTWATYVYPDPPA